MDERDLRPTMQISDWAFREWSAVYRNIGPRHAAAYRWRYDLGWTFAPGVIEKYLESERGNG